ncbi:hypothetical protein K493DRAFT_312446 [Basidiobolus meristosporus CBS 931.73]|uniref:Uncharacterized protein n=1 Tax=Basidiobolus meristosporus CBS 931.73 TaxID=1314790 RepID=A0A1Y1YTU9_9FUNG|nr:hypothetical protein K493DRAFT_312446 [Basidiobolus meristosporus CBS 931.73]|eukprot:ORY01389.1 hypothetical protein K493DRAFT_312446 [Basidiobolus meristosporus CBS 931.73]
MQYLKRSTARDFRIQVQNIHDSDISESDEDLKKMDLDAEENTADVDGQEDEHGQSSSHPSGKRQRVGA